MNAASKSVLVVDDEEDFRLLIRHHVEVNLRGTVYEADTGQHALDLAAHCKPALIVMELELPDIDGFEAIEKIKANPTTAATPILALSNYCQHPEWKLRALGSGCALCIDKGDFSTEGVTALHRLLG